MRNSLARAGASREFFSDAQKQPVHRYLFSHSMENDPQLKTVRANHTIEHAFLFPMKGTYKPSDADVSVQRLIVGYWTELARSGNTVSAKAPQWPVAAGDAYLDISVRPSAKRGANDAKCAFWDALPVQWPHL